MDAPVVQSVQATNECVLLSGVGWYIQAVLGAISFLSLIAKRLVEKPRRSWTVFTFDAGKQAIGALFAHSLNLSFASGQSAFATEGDACDYYWLNIMLDTTLGVLITYLALHILLSTLASKDNLGLACRYGYYGNPPELKRWASQLLLWLGVIAIMKITVLLCLIIGQSLFQSIAKLMLMPFDQSPTWKLIIVMIITPVVMNTFQYWITDNFIKFQASNSISSSFASLSSTEQMTYDVEDHQTLLYYDSTKHHQYIGDTSPGRSSSFKI